MREAIAAMTDANLTAAVATEVVGLTTLFADGSRWEPLTDWNHTWQVVTAMREKRFYAMCNTGRWFAEAAFLCDVEHTVRKDAGQEQRAILEAALTAVRGA